MNQLEFIIFKEETKKVLGQEVDPSFQVMPNGESRTRITGNGNINPFSYIRVEIPLNKCSGWQDAHLHKHTVETWIVEKGCQIVIEEMKKGIYKFLVMVPGDTYTSQVGIAHNCFVAAGSIIHTVKMTIGNHTFEGDWIAAPELDIYSKSLDMDEYLEKRDLEKYS